MGKLCVQAWVLRRGAGGSQDASPHRRGAQALALRLRDVGDPLFPKTPASGRTVLSGHKP